MTWYDPDEHLPEPGTNVLFIGPNGRLHVGMFASSKDHPPNFFNLFEQDLTYPPEEIDGWICVDKARP